MADSTIADLNASAPAVAAVQRQPDGSFIGMVGTTQDKFVDGFNGAALDPAKWDKLIDVGGMTLAVAGGALTIGMGTTNAAELLLVGKQDVTIPVNIQATLTISQRLAANEIRIGYLEVDPNTGVPIGHGSLAGLWRNFACMRFGNTTTSTNVQLDAMSGDAAAVKSVLATAAATNTQQDHSLELRPEDATLTSQASDSTAARSSAGGRVSSQVPSPDKVYRPFIHLRNNAAPASNTNLVLNRIVSMDLQELQVEAGGGRGNAVGSQAVPVVIAATAVGVSPNVIVNGTQTNAGSNNANNSKVISAASTNGTSLKTTAGRIVGGVLANTGAAWAYFKLYAKATAPVPGTDIPFAVIGLPPGSTVELGAIADQWGVYTATGIGYAITGGSADADTTAVTAGQVVGILLYS